MDFLPFFEASKSQKKNRVDIWSFVALNCPCGVSKDAVESARRPCGGCIKSRCGHWRHEPWGLKGRRWKESKVYYNYCIVMNVYYIHICVYMYEYKDLNMSMYALYKKYVYIYIHIRILHIVFGNVEDLRMSSVLVLQPKESRFSIQRQGWASGICSTRLGLVLID